MIINEWHLFLLSIYPLIMLRVFGYMIYRRYRKNQSEMKEMESRHRHEMAELIHRVLENAENEGA